MSQRIRIMQLVYGLAIGDHGGGSELFGLRLAQALPAERYEICVCPLWSYDTATERTWQQELEAQGIRVHYASPFHAKRKTRWNFLQALIGCHRLVRGFKPHIINTHGEYPDLIGLTLHVSYPSRGWVRTGHTELDWTTKPQVGRLLHLVYPLVCNWEVGVSQTIVEQLNQQPLMRLRRKRAHYIPNGVDPDVVRSQLTGDNVRAELGIAADAPLLGTVARLTTQKGIPYLVAAMPKVLATLPTARLVIAGAGDKAGEIQHQIDDLGVSQAVRLLGPRHDAINLIANLDVFVLPSLWEGLPTVLMEAMVVGTPVVATDIPGNRDLVHDGLTGLLVPPQCPDLLAEAMLQQYIQRQQAERMAQTAQQQIGQYTIHGIAQQYDRLYAARAA